MRASYEELPVALSGPGFESREGVWGDLVVARQSCSVPIETAELFRVFPDGTCPCDHWGVVLRGEGVFSWPDREIRVRAGDAYHAEPGHTFAAAADTELVEFTPVEVHERVKAALAQVLA